VGLGVEFIMVVHVQAPRMRACSMVGGARFVVASIHPVLLVSPLIVVVLVASIPAMAAIMVVAIVLFRRMVVVALPVVTAPLAVIPVMLHIIVSSMMAAIICTLFMAVVIIPMMLVLPVVAGRHGMAIYICLVILCGPTMAMVCVRHLRGFCHTLHVLWHVLCVLWHGWLHFGAAELLA